MGCRAKNQKVLRFVTCCRISLFFSRKLTHMTWLQKICSGYSVPGWNWDVQRKMDYQGPRKGPELEPKTREKPQMSPREVAVELGVELQKVPQLALDAGIRSFRTLRGGTVYDRKSVLEFKRTKAPNSDPDNIEWKGMAG